MTRPNFILYAVIFSLGLGTHMTWVFAQDVAAQVSACKQTGCMRQVQEAEFIAQDQVQISPAEEMFFDMEKKS